MKHGFNTDPDKEFFLIRVHSVSIRGSLFPAAVTRAKPALGFIRGSKILHQSAAGIPKTSARDTTHARGCMR
jgi:hypothetical protein